jgi:23S rRNA (cytidine1920-2'-O)/16S rRNA (cytidine1409-2'-O)-methyltransferase
VAVVSDALRFVSRGGAKLDAGLARFGVDVSGRRCLDAGASTGGFTHCLLQRGADIVVAVDVGYGQFDLRLRDDPRVRLLERTNIRSLRLADAGGVPFEVEVADLSFISLDSVAPVLCGGLAGPGADLVVLVKPQFEVGRAEAARGRGVVRDPTLRRQALGRAASALASQGATIMGAMASPVLGPAGNAEFLLHARAHERPAGIGALPAAVCDWLDDAVAAAPDAATTDAGDR